MTLRDRSFFDRDAREVAKELLGDVLARDDEPRLAGRIVETEAYLGPEDPASHARHGRTDRAAIMWDRPGTVYVYRVYGIHDMLNFVAASKGRASAVLVRAVEPTSGEDVMRRRRGRDDHVADGPGKLCEAFGITREHNGSDVGGPLAVEPGPAPDRIERTGRVGVVEDVEEPRRYVDAGAST